MSSAQVNRPTDVKLKEEDVSRKLQLYGIFTAFQNGKVPSNEQIDIALNSFLKSKALASPSTKLSAEGQGLVADFRTVVEQAKYLLLSKNEGNLLQDFIWQSQQISGGNAALPGAPVDKETARQHGNEALEGLRTLGTLIISNGQFRKLLNDATILIRDIAGDAAEKTASRVKPSGDQLSQIDAPAADNTWHESPDLSPGNLKSQFKNTLSKNTPVSKGDVRDAAGDATANADPHGSRDPADIAQKAQYDQTQGTNSGVDGAAGAQTGIQSLKDKASNNIDDEDKEKVRQKKAETRERAKEYLSQKMPEERREQSVWRLKKMIIEIQGHPDYQQAITTLLNLAEEYAGHANTIGQGGVGTVKGAHQDDALQLAEKDLKTLIERFANGTSTDDLFSSINTIYRDAEKDPELKNWFKQVDTYIRKCLKQQGYIMEDSATDEWNELYDRGNFLLRDRYRNHTDRIFDETKFLADQFDQDPQNKRFAESVQKLFNDLGNDENGKPTFKPHLVKDLTEVIIPAAFENVRYVPIPRIEFSDPTIDVVIENLVIESDNLMPNVLEVASDNYFRYGRKKIANKNSNSVMLSISGVQMDLRDVSFFVKRKQGFPSLTDQGVADIYLGGSGLSFKVKLSTADGADKRNFFKCDKVDVDVKNFNIKLKQSKHKLLFAVAKPILLKVLRPALQKALEKVIKDKVHELDTLAYEIKIEADRALAEAKENPDQAQNIYQRYVTAAQKKVMQGKQKTQEVASTTKVNVAVTQQDSIFPQVKLPGGISSEATKYKELAAKGDKWESPIFKIGSASPSTDIPSAIQITRKEHSVNEGGVRGPQNVGNTGSVTDRLRDPSAQVVGQNGNGNYTNGFSNQVDQAFSKDGSHNGTTLGSNNPVYNGSV